MNRTTASPDRRMTLIAELMASVALLSACGGGGSAGDAPAEAEVAAQAGDGTVEILARRRGTSTVGSATALPSGYVKCADEWGSTNCDFSGSTVVYYGIDGSWRFRTLSGPFDCNTGNTVFGDPAPGVAKACHIPSSVAAAPAPAPAN